MSLPTLVNWILGNIFPLIFWIKIWCTKKNAKLKNKKKFQNISFKGIKKFINRDKNDTKIAPNKIDWVTSAKQFLHLILNVNKVP